MATLTVVPQTVNVSSYAGDTLSIQVTVPTAFIAGRAWTAQIRATHTATTVDAQFVITTPTVVDGPAWLVLPAAETARLQGTSGTYVGVWDVQLAPAGGGDPTNTLARGAFTVSGDVTRLSA